MVAVGIRKRNNSGRASANTYPTDKQRIQRYFAWQKAQAINACSFFDRAHSEIFQIPTINLEFVVQHLEARRRFLTDHIDEPITQQFLKRIY